MGGKRPRRAKNEEETRGINRKHSALIKITERSRQRTDIWKGDVSEDVASNDEES